MKLLPAGRVVVLKVATPFMPLATSEVVPRRLVDVHADVVHLRNCTDPVGALGGVGVGTTVAVSVTDCGEVDGFGVDARPVAVEYCGNAVPVYVKLNAWLWQPGF